MSQVNELKKQITDLLCDEPSKESRTYAGAYARVIADKLLDVFFGWLGSLREDVPIEDKNEIQKSSTKDSIKVRHVILMLLNVHGGELINDERMQPEMYLLSVDSCFLGLAYSFDFERPRYGGPYSYKVAQAVDELLGAGFVYRTVREPPMGHRVSVLALTEEGRRLAADLAGDFSKEYEAIKSFVRKLSQVPGYGWVYDRVSFVELSLASNAHFLVSRRGEILTERKANETMEEFNWLVEAETINSAVNILKVLGLLDGG